MLLHFPFKTKQKSNIMSSIFDYSVNVEGNTVSLQIKSIDAKLGAFSEGKHIKGNTKTFFFRWYPRGVTVLHNSGTVELSNSTSASKTRLDTPAKAKTYAAQLTKAIENLCAEFGTSTKSKPADIKDHFTYELNLDTRKGEITFEVTKQSDIFRKFLGDSTKNKSIVKSAATVELHGSVDRGVSTIFALGHRTGANSHKLSSSNTERLVKVFGEVNAQLELAVKNFVDTHTGDKYCTFKKYTHISDAVGNVVLSLKDGEKSAIISADGKTYALGLIGSKGFSVGGLRAVITLDTESIILGTIAEYEASRELRDLTPASLQSNGRAPTREEFHDWTFAK